MHNNKLHTKPKAIKLSIDCVKAWEYLGKHGIKAVVYLRLGGEQAVLDKAKEYKFRQSKEFVPF